MVDDALAAFLSSPVMIIVGTADQQGRPEVGRAVGCRARSGDDRLELIVSGLHWPRTIANLGATRRAAATFSRPSDYETFQLKGTASLREPDARDLDLAEQYKAGIGEVLTQLGIPASFLPTWLASDGAVVLMLAIEQIFVQTPGPRAGQRVASG